MVKFFGYSGAFISLAFIGAMGMVFFSFFVSETKGL
jgi:hypothetical protein